MSEPEWIEATVVLAIHSQQIAEHGGEDGVRDKGLLESALAAAKHRYVYEATSIFQLAATYAHHLSSNHPFVDGNKRVALAASRMFLRVNGYHIQASDAEKLRAMSALATKQMDIEAFATWLEQHSEVLIP